MNGIFEQLSEVIQATSAVELRGTVTEMTGLVIEGTGPFVPLGSQVMIQQGTRTIPAQVVGFRDDRVLLMPFGESHGICRGAVITAHDSTTMVPVSDHLLGRVFNALGQPLDGRPLPPMNASVPLYRDPPNPIMRQRIHECFDVGVRSMNGMLTVGTGQRLAIMAGSGVGKSTLLGMVAKHSQSDINVIGLIGERGREVREFIERDLGPEGLARSVVVVATGNESALLRIRAALLATAYAEYFRDAGQKVVLMMDSVTRLAMAQREIGLAVGEPPSTRGYTPSVFSLLPKVLERAGTCSGEGSITGLYTVLVEGDDMNEPVADTVRGILDGHIVLSRKLAGRGHYPAIDILQSISRVMSDIAPPQALQLASMMRDILASYQDAEDLITIGAYKPGQNPRVDRAVQKIDKVNAFLRQASEEKMGIRESWQLMAEILQG